MNDQMKMRRNLLLGLVGLVLLLALAVLWFNSHKNSPEYTINLKDRDTGEVVSFQPNKTTEKEAGGNSVIILGSSSITRAGATSDQYELVKNALLDYSSKKLNDTYQTLTIIPSSLKTEGGSITGQLRLGQTDTTTGISIELSQLKYVRVQITDGNYDSGQMIVPTKTYQGTD